MLLENTELSNYLPEPILKDLAKVYGFKNRSDIYDLSINPTSQIDNASHSYVVQSLQKIVSTAKCRYHSSNPNNELRLIEALSTELAKFLDKYPNINIILDKDGKFDLPVLLKLAEIIDFTTFFTTTYQVAFREMLQSSKKEGTLTLRVINFILENEYDVPLFTLMQKNEGNLWLKDAETKYSHTDPSLLRGVITGFSANRLDDNEWLLVYNLPAPLGYFWWKKSTLQSSHNAIHHFIPWGEFYEGLQCIAHDCIDFFFYRRQMYLARLNPNGNHNPFSAYNTFKNPEGVPPYYYVWRVGNSICI